MGFCYVEREGETRVVEWKRNGIVCFLSFFQACENVRRAKGVSSLGIDPSSGKSSTQYTKELNGQIQGALNNQRKGE